MSNKILFQGSCWELTVRELILGIAIFAFYILCGTIIYTSIDRAIENHNAKYTAAPWVTDDDSFKIRLLTDSRDSFVYGKWTATPVTFSEWQNTFNKDLPCVPNGFYSSVKVRKEHYTRHTRVVHYTDSKGHTHSRTEVYYTWDCVWDKDIHKPKITFAGVSFNYEQIIPTDITKLIEKKQKGNDRWYFYADDLETDGIAFMHIEDKSIGTHNKLNTYYKNTPEDFERIVNSYLMGNALRIIFWIIFGGIGIALVVWFFIADNYWLNK